MELFDRTHKNKAGGFVDEKSEKIYNDVAARIDERETQLAQESADGSPVVLSTIEVDRIYEEHKARCRGRETHRHTLWLEKENQHLTRTTRTKKLQPEPNDTLVRKERPIDDLGESNQTSSSRAEETDQILGKNDLDPNPKSRLQHPTIASPSRQGTRGCRETAGDANPLQRSNLRSQTLTQKLVHIEGEAGQLKQQQQRRT
ncbi:hypothetical protein Bca4012_030651 [Brassica carinata]